MPQRITRESASRRRGSPAFQGEIMGNTYLSVLQPGNPGIVIRDMRREHGMSQEDIAHGVCSLPKYARIESGIEKPSAEEFRYFMEKLHETQLRYDDLYISDEVAHRALVLKLRQESKLDHWDRFETLLTVYRESFPIDVTPEKKQFLHFLELVHEYHSDDSFTGTVLYKSALTLMLYTRPAFSVSHTHIDFIPTETELMLLNALACGMAESHKEALYLRATNLLNELIYINRTLLHTASNSLIEACLLLNLAFFELEHGDLSSAWRHLEKLPARLSDAGGLYLYCKVLRCQHLYHKLCDHPEKCEEILSLVSLLLRQLPGSPCLSVFMKNSQKIMVF